MRHNVVSNKFGRTTGHRKALSLNLAKSLIEHECIKTTLPKAKMLRPYVEKLVTLGKKGGLHSYRQAYSTLRDLNSTRKLMGPLAERFKERPGGYIRIIKAGHRHGDNAPIAYIQFVDFKAKEKQAPAESAEATAE